jgi:DNA-binding CsgD family transcriptional regulator
MSFNEYLFLLDKIIHLMPGNVYWTDINSVYLGCNDNVTNMLGLKSRQEIMGITYSDMARLGGWTQGQEKSFKGDDQEVMLTGKPKLNIEEPPITDSEGNIMYFITSRVPLRDKNNQITGILGISTDITSKKFKLASELPYNLCVKEYKNYFTPRELDVFNYILLGLTSKKIAKRLDISFRTVEDYIDKIKIKLDCDSKSEVIEAAISKGIIKK